MGSPYNSAWYIESMHRCPLFITIAIIKHSVKSRVLIHQKLLIHHLDLVCPLRSALIQKYYFKKDYLKDSKVLSREVRAQDTMLGCL